LDFSVQEHTIVGGRSFYILSGFPFSSESLKQTQLLRYDRQERQFIRSIQDREGPLFLNDGAATNVLESDSAGLPQKFQLKTDSMTLTFQRGVGIVEARLQTANGVQIAKIASARVGQGTGGAGLAAPKIAVAQGIPQTATPQPAAPKVRSLSESVTNINEQNPRLTLQAVPVAEGHKLILTVTNVSDKLLPFRFNSSQSYDFVITNPATGQEVWRWSRQMLFGQVIRTESIRANGKWTFDEVVWNHRDNNINVVAPGTYQLVAIVTSNPPIQSEPVMIEIR